MAPRGTHLSHTPVAGDVRFSGGVRRKTPPRVFNTPPRSWLARPSPSRVTPPRTSPPRASPLRQLHSRLTRKMVDLWAGMDAGDMQRVVQLVQEVGPAVTRDNSGCSLLHVAAANNHTKLVEWLLKLLSPNLVNKAGLTPVHIAAMKGHTQVLRILLDDPHLDHLSTDPAGNTYKHWLCVPLFEAVLRWDKKKVQDLVEVGVDPDLDGGRVVGGALVRELRVTTARQLAKSLGRECILSHLQKKPHRHHLDDHSRVTFNSLIDQGKTLTLDQLPMGALRLPMMPGHSPAADHQNTVGGVGDVYNNSGAYVTILSYGSFQGLSSLELPSSHTGAHNLANVFTKLGYSGHVHKDLTEQQTRQVLTHVRQMEMLDEVSCCIFVVSSHSTPQQHFLTSDGHLMDTQWLCRFFRDSQCPRLSNKPKLFIFDLCCGYYKQKGEQTTTHTTRVEEPLRDTVCLYSNSGELTWYKVSRDGTTPFTSSLCRSLVHYGQHELAEIYRQFLTHYNNIMPMAAPHIRNVGFNKKFYFTPTPATIN